MGRKRTFRPRLDPPEVRVYRFLAPMHGLPSRTIGWWFVYDGRRYRIIGWNSSNRRSPILCRDDDRRIWRFAVAVIKAILRRNERLRWKRACWLERLPDSESIESNGRRPEDDRQSPVRTLRLRLDVNTKRREE